MKLEKKHYILGAAILAIILIIVYWGAIAKWLGLGVAIGSTRQYRIGGSVGAGSGFSGFGTVGGSGFSGYGSSVIGTGATTVSPVNAVVVNPAIVSERAKLRCCDWLDLAAYQACLAGGHKGCGGFLTNCHQGESCAGAARTQPFSVAEINTQSIKRGISDNIRLSVIRSIVVGRQ